MRTATLLTLLTLASHSVSAQSPQGRIPLDSGAVVRLTWHGDQPVRATLLAPLDQTTDTVHFCRYPSSGCGTGSVNPVRARPAAGLERIEVRRRGTIGRRTLIGAGIGALWGLLMVEFARSVGESPIGTGRQMLILGVSAAGVGSIGALLDVGSDRWSAPVDSQ